MSSALFPGNCSRTAELLRDMDWSEHPLGPIERWPASLRTAVGVVLDSPATKILLWGPRLFSFYNDGYAALLGTLPEHGIGKPFAEFRPSVWKDVEPFVASALAGTPRELSQMRAIVRREGEEEIAHFTICYSPVRDDGGAIAGVIADLVETTEHVRFQAALEIENQRQRALFDQAPAFMALAGPPPDYPLKYVNAAFRKLTGDRPLVDRPALAALPELGPQGYLAMIERVVETGEPATGWDVPFQIEDGPGAERGPRYLDFVFQPILGEEDQLTGILCIGYDATDRHLARRKAEKLQRDLHHVSRVSAMGTMAATIAHELSQPLTAAGNYLAGCRRPIAGLDAGEKEILEPCIERAHAQIRRASEIIRRARAAALSDSAPHAIVPIKELIDNVLELIETADSCAKDIEIHTAFGADPIEVCVDAVQIEQVLLNLIRNACQAMAGSKRREIRISAHSRGDGLAEVRVADTGRGLPPGQSDVFAGFVQSSTGGLGIGLSLSRTLVESHGGTMWAHNNADGGATFHFTLPVREALATTQKRDSYS